jgi:hypothetical protein
MHFLPRRFESSPERYVSSDPVRAVPHKTLRKAVNAQKLRCKDFLASLEGRDGISKTTMWKKFVEVGNCAVTKTFPEVAMLALSRAF